MAAVSYTLAQLAEHIDGDVQGDSRCMIDGIASLEEAQHGAICLYNNTSYVKQLKTSKASAIVMNRSELAHFSGNALIVNRPRLAFIKLMQLFHPVSLALTGIHPSVIIGDDCHIDESAEIAAGCVIGNRVSIHAACKLGANITIADDVSIGSRCVIFGNVSLYQGVSLGERVIIHSGTVIGSDGFGFEPDEQGHWVKMPQVGGVKIGDDVEIGSNTCIDRGTIDDTVIANGVKIDNLVQIAHNVYIGDHTIIAGCSGIGGSSHIGSHCVIGGACTITDHVTIANQVILTAKTGVNRSIKNPGVYASGLKFVQTYKEWARSTVRYKQLDRLFVRLKKLEEQFK